MKNWIVAGVMLLAIAAGPGRAAGGIKNFISVLNAGQSIPPNASTATGVAHLSYDTAANNLCFEITYSGLQSAEILAHIQGPDLPQGNGGAGAGIIMPLPVGNPKVGCTTPVAPFVKADLLKGLYYINIRTSGIPGGEIRGQILRTK